MHELSVAYAVVSTVERALPVPGARVLQVRLLIGELSGVDSQALRFAYDVAVLGTALSDAVLVIEHGPIVIACPTCAEQIIESARDFRCPVCAMPCGDVVRGKEMEIVDIILDDSARTDLDDSARTDDPVLVRA